MLRPRQCGLARGGPTSGIPIAFGHCSRGAVLVLLWSVGRIPVEMPSSALFFSGSPDSVEHATDHGHPAVPQRKHGLRVILFKIILLENLYMITFTIPAKQAKILAGLYLDVLKAAVHNHFLLKVQELYIAWHLREDLPDGDPSEEDQMLEVHEERELLGQREIRVLLRGEDRSATLVDAA